MMATLPDVLYLQLDNCPGQNKNRYMLGFLAFLIEANIFKKIKLSFLMVGHTHEDIDQVFSRFSVWLNNHNVWTFDELISGFEKSYTPQPVGMRMHAVYDWPDFLDLNSIVNHSRPHCFKFIKENGKASVYFKKWSTDKEWTKCAGESLLKSFSEAPIACVQPTTQKIDEKVENDIKLINSFYKNEESQAWWDSFFEDLKLEENTDVDCFNIVQALKEKKVAQQQSRGDVTIEIPSIDKPIPQVIIGSVKAVQTQSTIQEGDMVLCDVERYHDEWPQVARILNIDRDTYKILWYKGSMTGAWTPATRRVKGAKGKTEPYEDIVSKSEIWFSGFRFTPAGNLTRVTKDKLEAYFD